MLPEPQYQSDNSQGMLSMPNQQMENIAILYQIENSNSANNIEENLKGSQTAGDSLTNNCQFDNEIRIK